MIIACDVSNLAYSGYHALSRHLKFDGEYAVDSEEEAVRRKALFGFFTVLLSRLTSSLLYNYVFMAFDSYDGKCWRHNEYEDYKGQRYRKKSEAQQREADTVRAGVQAAISTLWEMRDYMPWYSLRKEACEADDLLAYLPESYPGFPIEIVSSDKDMRQIVAGYQNVSMYLSAKGVSLNKHSWPDIVTIHRTYKEKGVSLKEEIVIPPENYLLFRALSGDLSDNLLGLESIGTVTAAQICSQLPAVDQEGVTLLERLLTRPLQELGHTTVRAKKKVARTLQSNSGQERLYLNLRLMRLPSPDVAGIEADNIFSPFKDWNTFGRVQLWEMLQTLKFAKIIKQFSEFDSMETRRVNTLKNSSNG